MKNFRTPYFFRWIFHRRVWGFSIPKKVYLTFDDGPTEALTEWILNYLSEENVKATFFCVGENVKKFPALAEKMLKEGHVVANHTMRHEKGTKTPEASYLASIEEAAKYIDSDLFRPPYGRIPMKYTRKLRKKYKIIMWTWLSYDYDASVPVERIIRKARSIRGGDIIVVHDNVKCQDRLKQLLPELVRIVREKNLEFDVISS